ncbi:hypothetical protein [Cohnella sp. GCM10012308]|uniref:hypothetical protein n=1 Tax=Cohnella sp. GCM10012308 TaxID=3317329 RepID=UPI00361EBB83
MDLELLNALRQVFREELRHELRSELERELGPIKEQLAELGPIKEQLAELGPIKEQLTELGPIKERLQAIGNQLDRMEQSQAEDVVAMLGHLNNKLEVIRHDVEFVAKEQGAIRLEIDRSKRYYTPIIHEEP